MKTENKGRLLLWLASIGIIVPALITAVTFCGVFDYSVIFVLFGTPVAALAYCMGGQASETKGGKMGRRLARALLIFIGVTCILPCLFVLFMTFQLS